MSTAAAGNRNRLYQEFWSQFRTRIAYEHPDWDAVTGSRTAPRSDVPTGTTYTSLTSRFSAGEGLILQIIFKGAPAVNAARFSTLSAKKTHFEQALGARAMWDEMPGKRVARVYVTSPFACVDDVDQWPAMIDWLLDQHVRFKRAIEAVGGLDSSR